MSLAIGAEAALNRCLSLQSRALVGVRHFVYLHVVANELDCVFETVPEGRVAGAVNELVIVHEESLGAGDAIIPTNVIRPPVLAGEGPFHRPTALSGEELMGRQSLLLLGTVLFCVFLLPFSVVSHRIEMILAIWVLFILRSLLNDVVALDSTTCKHVDISDFIPNGLDTIDLRGHLFLNVSLPLLHLGHGLTPVSRSLRQLLR